METFFSFLSRRVDDCSSLLCVGLDPHPSDLPAPTADAARDLCLRLIKATAPYVAAFKPNAAFFELYGSAGWAALKDVIAAVQAESNRLGSLIPVILDAKRGDIATTAAAYARSAFEALGANAITLSPYLGRDSIEPFLEYKERGVFLLCKTSNPGAADLQDLPVSNGTAPAERLHLAVARLARTWNSDDNIGLVVGATQPEALVAVRAAAPELWFLVPGVGAQGGDLETALRAGLRPDGKGLLVNVSRAISRASDPARAAAALRDEMINIQYRLRAEGLAGAAPSASLPASLSALADSLLDAGCVQFGEFTLKSGLRSPIYVDLRQIISHPSLLARVAAAYLPLLQRLTFDRLAALPYAAIPIASAISLQGNHPLIYPRKEIKEYGTRAEIEGTFHPGEIVAVIDDLATTGGSKFEAIEKLTAAGLKVSDIVVLIDRQSGAGEALASAGYRLHAVMTITQMLDHWQASGRVPVADIQETRAFLARSAAAGQG